MVKFPTMSSNRPWILLMVAGSHTGSSMAWLSTATAVIFGCVVSVVVPREAMRRIQDLRSSAVR
ncbi:hypothetical protein [Novipirellula artificiosorum]|uniref:hypothetical protein n=1 Tax=Novipirellula artificiosorum TaxID=2528016 RepID=UPI0018CC985A|nr:hypothetical protein [Novipirellula artificiosorum]